MSVSYYEIDGLDSILSRAEERLWAVREWGTKMLYRLQHGHPLQEPSDWLQLARERLKRPPDSFWESIMISARAAMEVGLRYVIAVVHPGEDLIYFSTAATFVHNAISSLFSFGCQFEPSSCLLEANLRERPQLSGGFVGRCESFVDTDQERSPEPEREPS